MQKWGPRASPAQRVAWGEDEQGSGVRNARQGVLNGADFARTTKPVSFSLLEKERFLESKEKGAPVGVKWSQIGIRRPGFTPPLRSGPVHSGLPRWNRDRLWSYPTFFRRLRRRGSGRGAAARYSLCCGAQCRLFTDSLFTFLSSFYLWGAASRMRPRNIAPPGRGNQTNKRSAPVGALLFYAAAALLSAAGKRSS